MARSPSDGSEPLRLKLKSELGQLGFDVSLCFTAVNDVFTISPQEVIDRLYANTNRARWLVFVQVFEGEIRSSRFFDNPFDYPVDRSIMSALEAGHIQRDEIRMACCKLSRPDLVVGT